MAKFRSIDIPAAATSVAELFQRSLRHTGLVDLQAPEANLNTVFVGDKVTQPAELRPKSNGRFLVTNFNELFVRGTPPDKLTIVLSDV